MKAVRRRQFVCAWTSRITSSIPRIAIIARHLVFKGWLLHGDSAMKMNPDVTQNFAPQGTAETTRRAGCSASSMMFLMVRAHRPH
jgi:hypothetical protein